jgi:hypothetical protein
MRYAAVHRHGDCTDKCVDEKDFKKHLQDLAQGHHHPEEHDWEGASVAPEPARKTRKPAAAKKRVAKKAPARKGKAG